MDELVRQLSEGSHPVALTLRPEATVQELKECIEREYVHVKFTNTRGGTELGVRLDAGATDLSRANFDTQSGTIRLVGDLVLNDVAVRCVADVSLATFDGIGSLQPVVG